MKYMLYAEFVQKKKIYSYFHDNLGRTWDDVLNVAP